MVLRGHVRYNKATDVIEFRHTVIKKDTKCKLPRGCAPCLLTRFKVAMLYVEKDLSAVSKAIFDQWDSKKHALNHKILYCADARVSGADIIACLERGSLPPSFPRSRSINVAKTEQLRARNAPGKRCRRPASLTETSCISYTTRWACMGTRSFRMRTF
jgi:hypothetical protein